MSLHGTIVLEDIEIVFQANENLMVEYSVKDTITGAQEIKTVDQNAFFKALSIAIHNDGMPDWRADYTDAESVQPDNEELRFIP